MPSSSLADLLQRLARVRSHIAGAGLDALLVSHLPNIRYLTGFTGTTATAIVTSERMLLIVDFRYATAARDLQGAEGARRFEVVVADGTPDAAVAETCRGLACQRIGIEAASMPVGRFNRLSTALAAGGTPIVGAADVCPSLVPTERLIERARLVKDASEIATIREAAARLSAVARDLRRLAVPGRTEREIAAAIDAELRGAGFERAAFDTIVASGANSALPHARPTARTLQHGEGVVLDFGGVYDGYCVDLTRTLHAGARPAPLRRIFVAVAEAHAAAIAAVQPGVRASDIDSAARDVLRRHGLGDAFGHGTGHGLGLEVHEEPRLTKAGTAHPDSVIEPGMIFTIEPGVYVPGVGGVRIEDDVLVVDGGAELLTDVPIEL
jgi:Xaa-Pro aminopeptidase